MQNKKSDIRWKRVENSFTLSLASAEEGKDIIMDNHFDSRFSPYHIFIVRIDGRDYKVPHIMDDFEFERFLLDIGGRLPFGVRVFHFSDIDQILTNPIIAQMPTKNIPIFKLLRTNSPKQTQVKNKQVNKVYPVSCKFGDYAVCRRELGDSLVLVDGDSYCFLADMEVVPIHLKEAREYITRHHRHCGAPSFHKFSVSLRVDGEPEPVGVAVASTPKARHLMDERTLEINRVCVDPRYGNACSKLYAQVIRIGKGLGYTRFVTYTLPEESGASLKAVGFQFDGMTQDAAHGWDVPSRPRNMEKYPKGEKRRWILEIRK